MSETLNNAMISVLLDAAGSGGSFITEFFNGVAKYVKAVGSYIVVLAGVALIIASVCMLVKAFASRGGANWLVIIACLLTGGVLAIGGWSMITGTDMKGNGELGGIAKETLDVLSEGSGTVSDFAETGTSSMSSIKNARKGLYVISSQFILPFGKALAICTGVALIVLAIIQIAKFFFAGGRAQTSWLKVAAMCIIGSVLFAGTPSDANAEGWTWIRDVIGGGTKDTIINMSDGKASDASPIDANSLGENNTNAGDSNGADPSDVPG